ncbi:hypothetical protein ACRXLK_003531 [Cronobacter turicensis]|uniref:hypothetical protein n=1 Tax=Cronobacter TaxID=413496 RepID=UPI000CFAB523|nr:MULTISPECIES: hypothetical protein [Cronobacter]ELQ6222949.1 hypothetical protein [Cronobacter turicensis]ELY4753213.1 hypothetical protein [Cronobacter sakazakii]MDT3541955.1 hypothetical protein [Cronobacter sakazakii]MDT3603577.1 hypothetical protein [Cronobacter malonaticus]MDT3628367.1 hypothetical protein [Cronobacter sakazakii]
MRFSFQKTFTLMVGLCVLLLGGWVMNLLKLIASGDLDSHAGMTLARVVGVFLVPVGGILGFF